MRNRSSALLLTLCLGCASAIVRPYVGEQQSWPTATGSIVNMKYDMPILTSLPPTPYEVLAELRIESALYAQPQEGHLPLLVKQARKLGADALVFVDGAVFFSTNYGPRPTDAAATGGSTSLTQVNSFNPESFKPGVTVLAIRWRGGPPPGLPSKFATSQRISLRTSATVAPPAPVTSAIVAAPSPAPAPAAVQPESAVAPVQPVAPPPPPEPIAPADTNVPSAAPVQFH
jgi:hypothetical protein